MSLQAVGMLMSHPVMSPTLRGIALLIADCHNGETGLCCPSVEYLSKRSGMAHRGMQKNLKKLKEDRVIKVNEHFVEGRQTANTYEILPYDASRGEHQDTHEGAPQDTPESVSQDGGEGAPQDTQNQEYINQEYKPKTDMSGKPDVPPKSKPAKSKKSKPLPPIEDAVEVLEHLNGAGKKNYQARTRDGELSAHIKKIRDCLKSYSKAELIAMVDHKVWKWLNNPRMNEFIRPKTLFGKENCQEYVDASKASDAYQTASGNHQHARPSRPQTLVEQVQQSFDQQYGPITQQPYIEGEFSSAPDSAGHAAFVGQDDSDIYAQVDPYCDQ